MGSAINCRDLSLVFSNQVRAVDDATLAATAGQILSLVGPSGCGKTSMLRLMAGLEKPSAGHVTISPAADSTRGEIGFVFQQPALLRWRTAVENVTLPLELMSEPIGRKQRHKMAMEMLRQVDLVDAADRFPCQLSGGMRMRVSIARALVTQPSVLLLDEPFAALDDMLRNQLGDLILSLWQERRFTGVMVTHNIAEAITLSHTIAVMRRGKLEAIIANNLPWPRGEATRRLTEFGSVYGRVSDALRGDA